MDTYQTLKRLWHKLGFKGHINNYSSKPLWVVVGTGDKAVAYLLPPMTKTPPNIDADGFRRVDGKPVQGHKSWWKIYSGSTMEIFDNGDDLKVSVIKKTPVDDSEFAGKDKKVIYEDSKQWAVPIKLIDDVQRNKKKRITKYHITGVGWVKPDIGGYRKTIHSHPKRSRNF